MASLKSWWRARRPYVLSGLIYGLARFIGMTCRLRTIGYEEAESHPGGKIYAGWHGRTLLAANLFRNKGVVTIISLSRDGEMQNRIFTKFGFRTIRGSTGRGGARALAESIRALKDGATMAFTPDGPRGPTHEVQVGILAMAQRAGASIFPVGVSARPRWLAPTWDSYMVPWPFSRGVMIFGSPITVPRDADETALEAIRRRFEHEMNRLEAEAEAMMGFRPAER